ncbi:hypothetical protein [Streptomyces sp. NPDC007110]|uniref:hypothetical protein n=1 Tax=Streptomyces sp. NPDC007110 TaxID=3156916 RepID=UPI0033FAEF06
MAAMLLGMMWFAPDDTGGAGTTSEAPPTTGASDPAVQPSPAAAQDDADGDD